MKAMSRLSFTKKTVVQALSISAVVAMAGNAHADVLGKRYAGIAIGQVTPGDEDLKDMVDSIDVYALGMRLPASPNIDVVASVSLSKMDGKAVLVDPYLGPVDYKADADGTSLSAQLQYHFTPGGTVDPYVDFGILWAKSEVELKALGETFKDDDSDTGFVLGGGAEFNINKMLSVDAGLHYQSDMFDEDDTSVALALNVWATPQLLFSVGTTYTLDAEDMGVTLGLALGF